MSAAVDAACAQWDAAPDALVHCAGIYRVVPSLAADVAGSDHTVGVNARGSFLVARAVASSIIRNEATGSIVLLGSVAAGRGDLGEPSAAYAASKGAVSAMARQLAVEWGGAGIRVNCVVPGVIDTAMTTVTANAEPPRRCCSGYRWGDSAPPTRWPPRAYSWPAPTVLTSPEPKSPSTEGISPVMTEPGVPVVTVAGDAAERRAQYGEQVASRVHRTRDAYAEVYAHFATWDWDRVCDEAEAFVEPIEGFHPTSLAEMRGIAEGSGLPLVDILAIDLRTEILYAAKVRAAGRVPPVLECTAFSALRHR